MNFKPIYHFYSFNMDISLNIQVSDTKFSTVGDNNRMQGTMSQIFYLGLSFYSCQNKG